MTEPTERELLLAEANDLVESGDMEEFPANIPTAKLKVKIAEAKGEPVPVEEVAPPSPEVKAEPEAVAEPEESLFKENEAGVVVETPKAMHIPPAPRGSHAARRQAIAKRREEAMKTRVVTITNKDSRENDVVTTAYLAVENQHFGISRIVPLDVPVELEECLINCAKECVMSMHKDEIIKGNRTGNKVTVRTKKYAVSYENLGQ